MSRLHLESRIRQDKLEFILQTERIVGSIKPRFFRMEMAAILARS